MAIVRKLEPVKLERDSKHSEVNCTYSIVIDDRGAIHGIKWSGLP